MELKTWMRAQADRVAGGVAVAVGLLALLLGYLGVAGTAYPAEQIPYVLSGGVLGIVLIGLGATAWLSADLRDEWRKLDRIEKALGGRAVRQVDRTPPPRNGIIDPPANRHATTNGSAPRPRRRVIAR